MRKARRCTLASVALILFALAGITGIGKTGFVSYHPSLRPSAIQAPSKLLATHGRISGHTLDTVSDHGKSHVLPTERAEILQKQAMRPRGQELLLSWFMWALLTVLGMGAASLAMSAYSFGLNGAWSHFLADPTCGGKLFAIPASVLFGTLAQGFRVWQWSLAGGLGVAAVKAFGAREPAVHLGLEERVAALAARAGLPPGCPRVFVVPTLEPNAFAAGLTPSDSAVAVTEGLLHTNLSSDELDAVLAHEIGHILNGDCASGMQITIMVAGFSTLLSLGRSLMDGLNKSRSSSDKDKDEDEDSSNDLTALAVAMIFAGTLLYLLGYLLQLWHSRRREFVADEAAVALTGTGALADALAKIEQASWDTQSGKALAERKPEFSHMYISSHSDRESGFFGFISDLLKSHPQTHERKQAIGQTLQKVRPSFELPEPQSIVGV